MKGNGMWLLVCKFRDKRN